MRSFRTATCRRHGHPEITLQLATDHPIPGLERLLLDYFEAAVARGTRFAPGQVVRLGWAALQLCERDDGTLGVEERELTPEVAWTESVDRALLDTWHQKEIAASVGLVDQLDFPAQDDAFFITPCADDADAQLLTRVAAEGMPDGFSGWLLTCTVDHEHEPMPVPLLGLAANHPPMVQLLALPRGTTVLVRWRQIGDRRRIVPHVFVDGEERVPEAGSYLAALQG